MVGNSFGDIFGRIFNQSGVGFSVYMMVVFRQHVFKVRFAIVERVVVFMMDYLVARRVHYLPMHAD